MLCFLASITASGGSEEPHGPPSAPVVSLLPPLIANPGTGIPFIHIRLSPSVPKSAKHHRPISNALAISPSAPFEPISSNGSDQPKRISFKDTLMEETSPMSKDTCNILDDWFPDASYVTNESDFEDILIVHVTKEEH